MKDVAAAEVHLMGFIGQFSISQTPYFLGLWDGGCNAYCSAGNNKASTSFSVITCPHKPVDGLSTIGNEQNGFCVLLELR